MAERWLSVDEIAQHLGSKKDTVYKWVRMATHNLIVDLNMRAIS